MIGAAEPGTGENLDEVRAGLPCSHDFAGCQGTRKDHHILLDGELHNFKIEPRAAQKHSAGVEAAARAANERGYELTIVTDAVTDTARGAHLNSLEVIFPRIAELATTDDVLSALENTH